MAADTVAGQPQQQTTAAGRRASAVGRWAGVAALCLAVTVYTWHVHDAMERRVTVLEAAVAAMQQRLAEHPAYATAAATLEQPLRNKRDATSGQCLCPPGKCRCLCRNCH